MVSDRTLSRGQVYAGHCAWVRVRLRAVQSRPVGGARNGTGRAHGPERSPPAPDGNAALVVVAWGAGGGGPGRSRSAAGKPSSRCAVLPPHPPGWACRSNALRGSADVEVLDPGNRVCEIAAKGSAAELPPGPTVRVSRATVAATPDAQVVHLSTRGCFTRSSTIGVDR